MAARKHRTKDGRRTHPLAGSIAHFAHAIGRAARLVLGLTLLLVVAMPALADLRRTSPDPGPSPLTQVDALSRQGELVAALALAEGLLAARPERRDAYVAATRLAARLGAHSVATERIARHPEWFEAAERRQLAGDQVAQAIRLGELTRDAQSPANRHDLDDAAIAADQQAVFEGDPRARFDLLLALRQREAWSQMIALFERRDAGSPPYPAYVNAAAADAYAATHQPRAAVTHFRRAIEQEPGRTSWEWRVSLAYALVDSEQPDEALQALDALQREVGPAAARPSSERGDLDRRQWLDRLIVLRAQFERFAHRFDQSEQRLRQALASTPFDADLRAARSGLQLDRQEPHAALQTARRLSTDYPDSIWPRIATIEAQLELDDIAAAANAITDLRVQYGSHPQVERLSRDLQRRIAGSVRTEVSLSGSNGDTDAPVPVREQRMQTSIESPLIGHAFRVTGDVLLQHAQLPQGGVTRRRDAIGATYARADFAASVALSNDVTRPDRSHTGVQLQARKVFDDHWRASARYARDADDVPLRAVRAGIRLDSAGVEVQWQDLNRRALTGGVELGRLSDGNQREQAALAWRETWIDRPRGNLQTRLSLDTARFAQQQRPYFSPASYSTLALGVAATGQLYRRYDTWWRHRLVITPMLTSQNGYASRPGVGALYEHRWEIDARWGGRAAVDYTYRPYDGKQESRWIASLELFMRF